MQTANMSPAMKPTWRRAFIALWPGPDSRQRLAQSRPPATPGVRPIHPDDLHLTLAFLGDLNDVTAATLVARLRDVTWTALALDSQPSERWPATSPARVLVLPFATTTDLLHLHDAVRAAVRSAALPVETRAYRPHVTLARLARGASAEPSACPAGARFVQMALCHGLDAPAGEPRYRLIAALPAAGAGPCSPS